MTMPIVIAKLTQVGPVVRVRVGIGRNIAIQFEDVGLHVPNSEEADAIIDTGSAKTVIDTALVKSIGLAAVGNTTFQTASTPDPQQCNEHVISLSLIQEQRLYTSRIT